MESPNVGDELAELVVLDPREIIRAARGLLVARRRVVDLEQIMEKVPHVRGAMAGLSLADVENHDAKPAVLRRGERRLRCEGETIATLEMYPADDRLERTAQPIRPELLAARIDSKQPPHVGVAHSLAGERIDLALHRGRNNDLAGLRQRVGLVVWAEAIRDGCGHELVALQRAKTVAVELAKLAVEHGVLLLELKDRRSQEALCLSRLA